MIEKEHKPLPLYRQCELLGLSRTTAYYKPKPEKQENILLMGKIDKLHTEKPYLGVRRIHRQMMAENFHVSKRRIRRLMHKMGIIPIYAKKNLSRPAPEHKKYPYLLRDVAIERVNQVWSMDITYVPMKYGYMYLTAVMDWYSRKVLAWKTSNTMTIEFCRSCLQDAIDTFGTPEIFNTDQGSQFTSTQFTSIWKNYPQVIISMDGRGRATDNAFIERLWRSVKEECIRLNVYDNGASLYVGLHDYFADYNSKRLHQGLQYKTPDEMYHKNKNQEFILTLT